MHLRLLAAALLLWLAPFAAGAGERAPILTTPPTFGEQQFRLSCVDSRGYGKAQCDCALRAIRRDFDGRDRDIALLYLQLTMIAEHDVEAIMAWLDVGATGACPPQPSTPVSAAIAGRHLAPAYLYGVLSTLGIAPQAFKEWPHRDRLQAIRDRCLPVPAAISRQAQRIEACIEEALDIKHCSRCHDLRGVDLME